MSETREVVVVGGGPAGSTAAHALAARGHDVLLLDEARFPRDKICGEAVSPGGWRILEGLGAAAAVTRAGVYPLSGMELTAPDGTSFRGRYDGGRRTGFSIERYALDAVLLDRARSAGVEVREGAHVSGLQMEGGAVRGVQVRGDAGEEVITARLVIGADGRRSRVARALGLLKEAKRPRRFAVRGYWQGMNGLSAFGEMHVDGRGYCGVAPLRSQLANVTFVVAQDTMQAAASDLEAFYKKSLRRWPRVWDRLSAAHLRERPRAIGPLALECARPWAPGVLLVGDAAGFFDPFTGEGITLALKSALLAAEVAHETLTSGAHLETYGKRHRTLAREKFRFNHGLQWLIGRPWLANVAAHALAHAPWAADRLVGIAGDLWPEGRGSLEPAYSRMTSE